MHIGLKKKEILEVSITNISAKEYEHLIRRYFMESLGISYSTIIGNEKLKGIIQSRLFPDEYESIKIRQKKELKKLEINNYLNQALKMTEEENNFQAKCLIKRILELIE